MSRLPFAPNPLCVLVLTALAAGPCLATDSATADLPLAIAAVPAAETTALATDDTETISITGQRLKRVSKGATNLPLSVQETPQSVTVIDRDWLEAFAFDDINQALRLATGVNVEAVETDRTYYNARGFDIKSMQVDGIGLPFNWNVVGALDTALYEKVEIIRGANGLLTGTGNPSGTINYVRKRPQSDFAGSVELTTGSWDKRRLELDVTTPLTDSGSWAGRMVAVKQTGDSYLDHYQNERNVLYGVIDGQIGDHTVLTFGYTRQDNESDGVLWGALPMQYTDGSQTDFDASASTTMDWTYWNTYSKTAFAEIVYALPADWQFKAVLTHNDYDEPSELFYIWSSAGLELDGTGLFGWPGKYTASSDRKLLDATVSGGVELGGREHQLLFGLNIAQSDNGYLAYPVPGSDPAWGALPSFPGWTGQEVPRPAFGAPYVAGDWQDEVQRLYAISQLNVADGWQLIVGFNAIDVETKGVNFGETMVRDEQEVSPYLGATWTLNPQLNLYASYSDIYEPQPELDINQQPVGAAIGTSYELGAKSSWFADRLLATLALFRAEQENYATYAGFNGETGLIYYAGADVDSEGVELEASGRIGDDWKLLAGYTKLELTNPDGSDTRTFIPRETFNLGLRYNPAALAALELGGTVRWQDDIQLSNWLGDIEQQAYTLVSLYASYELTEQVSLAANLNNATDEKYLASLYWDQALYGAPRNWTLGLTATF